MRPKSDTWEILRSTVPLILWLLVVFLVIMAAPSLDKVMGW